MRMVSAMAIRLVFSRRNFSPPSDVYDKSGKEAWYDETQQGGVCDEMPEEAALHADLRKMDGDENQI